MIPAGYMYKKTVPPPGWVIGANVVDVYSVSNCVSDDFADYINYWKHNGYRFFDSPQIIEALSADLNISLDGLTLFFYRLYPFQWNSMSKQWENFASEQSFETNVVEPLHARTQGFDVVTYYVQTSPECSPLSCNNLAEDYDVNEHCLFRTFEAAMIAIESGVFEKGEPGPYRIVEVCTCDT